MKASRIVRTMTVIILLVAFVLPLSRCDHIDYYAWTYLAYGVGGLLNGGFNIGNMAYSMLYLWVFLAFIWPLPFAILEIVSRWRNDKIWKSFLQILLSSGSMLGIHYLKVGELMPGGYIAISAFGIYLSMSLAELVLLIAAKSKLYRKVDDW